MEQNRYPHEDGWVAAGLEKEDAEKERAAAAAETRESIDRQLAAIQRRGPGWQGKTGASPNLGLATTRELLEELRARIDTDYVQGGGGLEYTTVKGRPEGLGATPLTGSVTFHHIDNPHVVGYTLYDREGTIVGEVVRGPNGTWQDKRNPEDMVE